MRRTKIVCTLGPAVDDYKMLAKLCASGMNVARFNFSHGDYEQQGRRIELFKAVREDLDIPIPMMLDTRGPEIRIGNFENKKVTLKQGDEFTLLHDECLGDESKVYVNYPMLYKDITIGSKILINDGLIELEVTQIIDKDIKCSILNGGNLTDKKSVNVPGLVLNLPVLTDKDKEDIIFGVKNGFEIIAVSFVRKPEDILAIKEVLKEHNALYTKIIAKIENQEGVQNFDQILKVVDGIMVARGDLGVEIPMQQIPILQKEFVKKCNAVGKLVIIATQMLESMVNNPRPTRAEVSDVANAVLDGTSAIMLSAETAAGNYPIECVETMDRIAETIEKEINYWDNFLSRKIGCLKESSKNLIVGHALCEVAMQSGAEAIFSLSSHGNTPTAISSFRPECPIYMITPDESTARKMNLAWGVVPILVDFSISSDEMIRQGLDKAKELDYIKSGQTVIIGESDTHSNTDALGVTSSKMIGGIYVI